MTEIYPCPNCDEPKVSGEPCDDCGFWTNEDLDANPGLKERITAAITNVAER